LTGVFRVVHFDEQVSAIFSLSQRTSAVASKTKPGQNLIMPDDLPLDDDAIDQIWQNAPSALPSAKELARAKALLADPNHPHNLYPNVKPPQTRLQAIIGHLPLESQRKIVAALRAALPEHNRMADKATSFL
jgi:hypothetical protein